MQSHWFSLNPFKSEKIALLFASMFLLLVFTTTASAQVTFLSTQFPLPTGSLSAPAAVAIDTNGDILIADQGNHRVVMLPAATIGYSAAITVASGLGNPAGLALDPSGNLFITDSFNDSVLMTPLGPAGYGPPVTVATGFNSPTGIAIDTFANIVVADTGNNQLIYLPYTGSGYGTPSALTTGLNSPQGLAYDQNRNLYIANTGANTVLKLVRTQTGYSPPQTWVHSLNAPVGVAVDLTNDLYISESGVTPLLQCIWNAGANRFNGCTNMATGVQSAAGIALSPSGMIVLADAGNNQVLGVTALRQGFPSSPLGTPVPAQAYNFQIASGTQVNQIQIFSPSAATPEFADAGTSTCAVQMYTVLSYCAVSVLFTPNTTGSRPGAIVLSDPDANTLNAVFISGVGLGAQTLLTRGVTSILGAGLNGPAGVAVDGNGNLFIADTGNNRIVELPFTSTGFGLQTTIPVAGVAFPMGIAVDVTGALYIASSGNDRVFKLPQANGVYGSPQKLPGGYDVPSGVAVDPAGNIFVANTYSNMVNRLPWTGNAYGVEQFAKSRFPISIAVDGFGWFYTVDPYISGVAKMSTSLAYDTLNLNSYELDGMNPTAPAGVAVDGNGNLFILDTGQNTVSIALWNGASYSAPILLASGFNSPSGLAVDSQGDVFVADTGNNQIVEISLSQAAQLNFSPSYVGSSISANTQKTSVANTGNQSLAMTAIQYPQDFPESTTDKNACASGISLAQGSVCEVAAAFSPSSVGSPLNEGISIIVTSTSAAAAQVTIPVMGNSLPQQQQTIAFPAIQNVVYGSSTVALSASSSSGLPVTIQVISGPAVVSSNSAQLTITGAGTVVLMATQNGNVAYLPAPSVCESFSVIPATLTVTPSNTSAIYGSLPASYKYTITGFVAGESASSTVTGMASIQASATRISGVGIYSLSASIGTLTAPNYSFTFATGTLTITPAALVVTPAASSSIYGSSLPSFSYIVSGFVNGDTAAVMIGAPVLSTVANSTSSAGTYPLLASQGTLCASNYFLTFSPTQFVVLPASLTVTAASITSTYGRTIPTLPFSISGFVNGDTQAAALSGLPQVSTPAGIRSAPGQYPISVTSGTLRSRNYIFAFVPGVLTIQQAMVTVTPRNASMTYGSTIPSFTYQVEGLVRGDTPEQVFSGAPSLSTTATSGSSVGTYPITASQGTLNSTFYSITFASAVLTVNPALLSITALPAHIAYGSTLPQFSFTLSGLVNGDSATAVTGVPALSTVATPASGVGSYAITCSKGTLSARNYIFSLAGSTLIVAKATLTVVAGSVTSVYGSAFPEFQYQLTGFLNGDTGAVVTGAPLFHATGSRHSPVGIYALEITNGTLAAHNYSFQFVPGSVTIIPSVLTVTAANRTMTYGAALPALHYSIAGFVNGDGMSVLTGAPSCASTESGQTAAGTYPINCSQGSLAAQSYTFAFAAGVLTVEPATLTVTALDQTATYGAEPAPVGYTITGFVNADTQAAAVNGRPQLASSATSLSSVGYYPITIAAGTLAAQNYTFVFSSGRLTITRAVLTVTGGESSMIYGGEATPFAYTISGFVNGDTASVISGAPLFHPTANRRSSVGSYPLELANGSLYARNYSFQFVNGTIDVNPAVLTVTAASRKMTYGAARPALSYSISGFVNGDSVSVLTGEASCGSTGSGQTAVGPYPINCSVGTLAARNYTFAFAPGTLSVEPAVLIVTALDQYVTYGAAPAQFAYSLKGFVNSDTQVTSISGAPQLSSAASSLSPVGNYTITALTGTLTAQNYTFVFAPGRLSITRSVLTVAAGNSSMTYGGEATPFTYTISGFVNGDTASVISGAPLFHPTANRRSSVGSYPLELAIGSMYAHNYSFQFVNGTITVNPAVLSVTAASHKMTYGAARPALSYSISGFVNGDTVSVLTGEASCGSTGSGQTAVGPYPINCSVATLAARNYTFAFAPGTLSVEPAVLTVAALDQSATYGALPARLAFKIRGFVNEDTQASSVYGSPQLATAATALSPVGKYAITIASGTLAARNYSFDFLPGSLSIIKAVLTVTGSNATMIYGGEPTPFTYTLGGFVNGDTPSAINGTPLFHSTANRRSPVGAYTLELATGTLSARNYSFQFVSGTVTVTPSVLSVSAKSQTTIYGAALPALAYSIGGFVNGDTPGTATTGAPVVSTTASSASPIGTYAITAAAGTLRAGNYTFVFAGAVLTITPASLTVTANNISMKQGAALPALTFTADGFVNKDTLASAATGSPALTTSATSASAPGVYEIGISQGSFAASNYELKFVRGKLTIDQ